MEIHIDKKIIQANIPIPFYNDIGYSINKNLKKKRKNQTTIESDKKTLLCLTFKKKKKSAVSKD